VADVTSREERSKAMGIVGAAFGLGLGDRSHDSAPSPRSSNLLHAHPSLARFGINPFAVPALHRLRASSNLAWIYRRFNETLTPRPAPRPATRASVPRSPPSSASATPRSAGPNLVAFVYSLAFVAMEASLTFLAAERFGYTARETATSSASSASAR